MNKLTLLILFGLVMNAGAETKLLRVYVYTEGQDGFRDAALQRRMDTVKDIEGAIAKKKNYRIVEDKADADILLEVTGSGQVATGTTSRTDRRPNLLGGTHLETTTQQETKPGVFVTLHVPGSDYTMQFGDVGGFWRVMAGRVANQFDSWVQANLEHLEHLK